MRASDIAFLQNIDKEGITIHRRETVNNNIKVEPGTPGTPKKDDK